MKAISCGLGSLVFMVAASAQNPQSAPDIHTQNANQQQPARPTPAPAQPGKTNAEQLQRDADELMALTQSIPADIDTVNRGLLPKDVTDKLKRIEKLSKQLRKELGSFSENTRTKSSDLVQDRIGGSGPD